MRRVIDFHAHMGDIFTGRNVSFRTGLPRPEDRWERRRLGAHA